VNVDGGLTFLYTKTTENPVYTKSVYIWNCWADLWMCSGYLA